MLRGRKNGMPEEQLNAYWEEYKKLSTFKLRINYWNAKLPLNFFEAFVNENWDLRIDLQPFYSFPSEDWEEANFHILDNYPVNDNRFIKKLDFDELKEDFQKKLKNREDKRAIIDELKSIKESFEEIEGGGIFRVYEGPKEFVNKQYNADYKTFTEYVEWEGLLPDYRKIMPNIYGTISVYNGVILAKYYTFLQSLSKHQKGQSDTINEEAIDSDEQKEKNAKFNIRVQLQILHFIGVLGNLTSHTTTVEQKGAFFGALLNRNSQRARRPFSSKSLLFDTNKAEAKNIRRDLMTVKELLTGYGLTEYLPSVEKAIQKINSTHFKDESL